MNLFEQAIQNSRLCNQIPYQYDLGKFRANLISVNYKLYKMHTIYFKNRKSVSEY